MKNCLLFFAVLFLFHIGYSQDIKFEHLTLENGLPVSWVRAVCKDKMGFVWLGTNNGFCRFDGYSIKSYFNISTDSTSICGNQINAIKELSDGRLIIGTLGTGFSIFDPKTEKFKCFFNKRSDKNRFYDIFDIQVDRNNMVWLSTVEGILLFNPSTYQVKEILPFPDKRYTSNNFYALLFAKDGTLWASNQTEGIVNIDPKSGKVLDHIRHQRFKPSLGDNADFQCTDRLEFDPDGGLWIATQGLGLWRYKDKQLTNVLQENVNTKLDYTKYFNKGICLVNNKMWVGFDGYGLGVFDTKTLKGEFIKADHNKTYGLNTATMQGIYTDNTGTVWITTYDGGVNIYNPNRFKFSSIKPTGNKENELSNRSVWSFLEAPDGKIWIGTDGGGINILDPKNEAAGFSYIKAEPNNPNALSSNVVIDIKHTKDDYYWFGTYLGGICRYDPRSKKFKSWLPTVASNPKAPATNLVWDMLEDSHGTFWLSCLGSGIDTLDRKTGTFYHFNGTSKDRRFNNGAAYIFYEDKKRVVWVCTDGNGLQYYSYDNKKFQIYQNTNDPSSLPSDKVYALLEDADGAFWVGTSAGLSLLNRQTGKFYLHRLDDNVIQPTVFGILQDNRKRLWISTNRGLFCYDFKRKLIDHFDKTDGLQGNEYKYGCCLKSKDGKFYFGGTEGFDAFYPDSVKTNMEKPRTYLTQVLLFNKAVSPNDGSGIMNCTAEYLKELTFNHNQSVITLRYLAVNFTNSSKNQYAYRLSGFEKDWNYVGTKREASYTNLDPGTYIFEVKASNNDGLWNDKPLQIKITIVPPFWMTWWFRLLVLLFILSASAGYYLNRINRLKERQRFLEEKVEERTQDLRKANIALEQRQEEILQQQEEILAQKDELEQKNNELLINQQELFLAYDKVNKSYKDIQVISDFGQKITSTLDAERINLMTYQYISTFMELSSLGIGIYHKEKQLLEFSNYIEDGQSIPPFYIGADKKGGYLIDVVEAKSEVVVHDVAHEYSDFVKAFSNRKSYMVPQSIMYYPLQVENKLIGLIVVTSLIPDAFTEVVRNNIKAMASYIAIADENASVYKQIEQKNAAIKGSIRYGLTIQKAMQISEDHLKKYFDSFVISKPKDIVSGDFYWFSHQRNGIYDKERKLVYNNIYFAVVDCTGHGVPGAFMSMIGNRLLNSIVNEKQINEPSRILDELNLEIANALQQAETENNDGMDVGLIVIQQPEDPSILGRKLIFAGAKLPLIYYSAKDKELSVLKGDRQSIGGIKVRREKAPFTQQEIFLEKDDVFYLGSDGLIDQCDLERKRFGSANLYRILESHASEPMSVQKKNIEDELSRFMIGTEQRDDITFVGVKL